LQSTSNAFTASSSDGSVPTANAVDAMERESTATARLNSSSFGTRVSESLLLFLRSFPNDFLFPTALRFPRHPAPISHHLAPLEPSKTTDSARNKTTGTSLHQFLARTSGIRLRLLPRHLCRVSWLRRHLHPNKHLTVNDSNYFLELQTICRKNWKMIRFLAFALGTLKENKV
jgi:hypothetical protein